MERITITPRSNVEAIAERYGFDFTVVDDSTYWDESRYYKFTLEQIERDIENPTDELHQLILEAAGQVIQSDALLRQFAIPETSWDAIRNSWAWRDESLYGRLDLRYDGQEPAKLYEANYDTPTSLFEAAVFQWDWLESLFPHLDQYNSLHESLIDAWRCIRLRYHVEGIHFAGALDSAEDRFTLQYLMDTAVQAGLRGKLIDIQQVGFGNFNGDPVFTDLQDEPIRALFKLYPYEHLMRESFAPYIGTTKCGFIEPPWKAVISNKAILPLLWQMNPGHPNLIESYPIGDPDDIPEGFVVKPYFSREGAGIHIPGVETTAKEEFPGGLILQRYMPPPRFGDDYPVIGSWVVGGKACGMGIREDASVITKNTSRFVPHVIAG